MLVAADLFPESFSGYKTKRCLLLPITSGFNFPNRNFFELYFAGAGIYEAFHGDVECLAFLNIVVLQQDLQNEFLIVMSLQTPPMNIKSNGWK
jgi:hypothetical protein